MRSSAAPAPSAAGAGSSCSKPPSTESRSSLCCCARTGSPAASTNARQSAALGTKRSGQSLLELPDREEIRLQRLAEADVLRRQHRAVQRLLALARGHGHLGRHPDAVDLLELLHLEVLEARALLHPVHAAHRDVVVLAHEQHRLLVAGLVLLLLG